MKRPLDSGDLIALALTMAVMFTVVLIGLSWTIRDAQHQIQSTCTQTK